MRKDKNMEQGRKNRASNRIRLEDIKVTVHIPDNVSESVRREKINRIYDILRKKKA